METLFQEDCLVMEEIHTEGYEKVYKVEDSSVGLKALICLHNLTLGPGLGGTRIYPYPDFETALTDVKRLAKGMTYKSAISGCCLGGAKSVIMASQQQKTPELLRSFGRAIERLEGLYIAAEDVGCNMADVGEIAATTKYVVGLSHDKSSGNPSYFTAWGTYRGIQASLQKIFGSDSVKDKVIAIQGMGSVGSILAGLLFWNGAKIIVSDVDTEKAKKIAKQYSATYVDPSEILSSECDVLSPCALGGIINDQTIPTLRCKAIAGAANNQLLVDANGDDLVKRGILYAPDFVINAGGLINVAEEIFPQGYDPVSSRDKVDSLYGMLISIFETAERNGTSTHKAAMALGDHRIENKINVRSDAPCFHHAL